MIGSALILHFMTDSEFCDIMLEELISINGLI